jgi:type I restriction enzyme, S subunit
LKDGTQGSFERVADGVPLLSAKNIYQGKLLITEVESLISEFDFESINKNGYLQFGDVLMTIVGSIGNVAIFETKERVAFQRSVAVLRPNELVVTKFLYYLLQSVAFQEQLRASVKLSAQGGVYLEDLGKIRISIPSVMTQSRIVATLDQDLEELDTLSAAKQRLLDLLAEKRRAIVAEAIMRGLNPSAPLRPSGIDWLGDIPTHWEIERSRWLFNERDERSETGEEEMLTVSHLTGVTPRSEKDVNMFEAESTVGYKLCLAGDLAINTLWAWMGAMGTARVDGIVSPAYNVYTPGPRLLPAYVDALVRIQVFAQEVTRYSKGVWSSRLRLYPEGFFETYWPVPPLHEQHEIVRRIAAETAKTDRLRAATEHSITLLKERRGALIAAAVTGQIDIPEAA